MFNELISYSNKYSIKLKSLETTCVFVVGFPGSLAHKKSQDPAQCLGLPGLLELVPSRARLRCFSSYKGKAGGRGWKKPQKDHKTLLIH